MVSEATRELLATGVRLRRTAVPGETSWVRPAVASVARWPGVWKRVGGVLDRAAFVQVLSRAEIRWLQQDTGWSGANAVLVPNGRPEPAEAAGSGDAVGEPGVPPTRDIAIVQVGRIEPRKRQLEAARLADRLGIEVTFVGALNPNFNRYGAEFESLAERSPRLTWLGRLSHDETVATMRRARALINPSWAEVQSLVDIEAHEAGCELFLSDTGSTPEYIPDAHVYPHAQLAELLTEASQAAPDDTARRSPRYPYTWDDAASVLDGRYRDQEPMLSRRAAL